MSIPRKFLSHRGDRPIKEHLFQEPDLFMIGQLWDLGCDEAKCKFSMCNISGGIFSFEAVFCPGCQWPIIAIRELDLPFVSCYQCRAKIAVDLDKEENFSLARIVRAGDN